VPGAGETALIAQQEKFSKTSVFGIGPLNFFIFGDILFL
jgi:hypothetical protein